jgi:hypothetical protein
MVQMGGLVSGSVLPLLKVGVDVAMTAAAAAIGSGVSVDALMVRA